MYRTRSLVLLAVQLATAAALFPTPAGAEPKNESPFTSPGVSATIPAGEAKNEMPFRTGPANAVSSAQFVHVVDPAIATAIAAIPEQQSAQLGTRPQTQSLDTAIATAIAAQTAERHSAQLGTRPQTQSLDTAIATAMAAQGSEAANALGVRSTGLNQQYNLGTNATDAGATQALHAVALRGEALNRQYQLGRYTPGASRSPGFGWSDAGIGAGAMLLLALFATAFGLSVRRSHSEGRVSATVG